MKKLIWSLAVVSVLVCVLCQSVVASTVVYSQPYNTDNAYVSDLIPQLMADDFVLPMAYDITDVHWWGAYSTGTYPLPPSDDFTIAFHTDDGGGFPSADPLAGASYAAGDVGRSDTGDTISGDAIYAYSYDLPAPLSLAGGTTYYISIYNATPDSNWLWETGDGPNDLVWYRSSPTEDWIIVSGSGDDLAFELTVANGEVIIPEPVTSTLFVGSVLLGLGRLRRRRA